VSVRTLISGLVVSAALGRSTTAAYAQAPAGRGRGGAPRPADVAAPRTDRNSQLAHEQLLEKARAGGVDVYVVGDSIARRWGATDYPQYLANWRENFFGWNAGDFAWGADRVENILWRLENGELDGVDPKVFVVHGGTNNLTPRAADPAGAAEIARGMAAVIYLCRQKAPSATIILTGIFPRNDNMALLPAVAQVNESLARLADGKTVRYLNINDKLADANGVLYDGMMRSDKLHPDLKGYQVWADALKPILTEILGPPAATDHAPPPTGDPSAAGRGAGPQAPATRP
jgi:lysophospholipase L1-like esterase